MNIIDYMLIGIVFLYALMGFASGTLAQLCSLANIILSLLAGYLFYAKTGNLFLVPIIIFAVAVVIKIIIYNIRKVFFKPEEGKKELSFSSRTGGASIASLKGIVAAYILLICIYLSSGILAKFSPAIEEHLQNSLFYSRVKEHELLPRKRTAKNIYFAGKLVGENLMEKLSGNEEIIRKLEENPSFDAVLKDEKLQEDIQKKDYRKIVSHPKFLNLLKDKDFLDQIQSIDFEDIYKQETGQRSE